MTQKHKTDHTKQADAIKLAALLKKIEEKTTHAVKGRLGHNWRDNLFEIMMTRLELATPHKKEFMRLPAAFRKDPQTLPEFACGFLKTMSRMLKLAKAPSKPHHVVAFSLLYATVIDTFLK